MAMLEEAAAKRLYEEVERVTVRSERLQQQLDKERAVNDSLRAQLRNAAAVQQQLNVQIRGVTGSSAGARSLQTAGGGGLGNVTLMGLQRKVDALHNRIDVEKRAANAERAEKIRLEELLKTAAAEKQRSSAVQEQLRVALSRKQTELDRALAQLREHSDALDDALAEVSRLGACREREAVQAKAHAGSLAAQLDAERLRAANRAARESRDTAARRRAAKASGGIDSLNLEELAEADAADTAPFITEPASGSGSPPSSPTRPRSSPTKRPSAAVSAIVRELESERRRRVAAEEAAANAQVEAMHARCELMRDGADLGATDGGRTDGAETEYSVARSCASSAVQDRQLDAERAKSNRLGETSRRHAAELQQLRAHVCMLADSLCVAGRTGDSAWGASRDGGGGRAKKGGSPARQRAQLSEQAAARALAQIEAELRAASDHPTGGSKRRQQRELAATVGPDRAISPPGIGTATDDDGSVASPAPLTRTQARGAAAASLL